MFQFLLAQKSSKRYAELLSPEIKWFLPVMTRINKVVRNLWFEAEVLVSKYNVGLEIFHC
jgi:hypothetical protein